MTDTTYILGQPQYLIPLSVVAVVFAILVVRNYWNSAAGSGVVRTVCGVLKICGFLILAFCLLEPLLRGQRPTPGENVFILLTDRSESLNIRNPGAKLTRGDRLKKLLASEQDWLVRLAQDFDVRKYEVGTKLESVDQFEKLKFEDAESRLKTALATITKRLRNRPVAGILFFTDGNATDLASDPYDIDEMPPLYPVIQGSAEPITDLEVEKVSVSQSNFEAAPVEITATVRSREGKSSDVIAELLDESGAPLDEQRLAVDPTGKVVFKLKPDAGGIRFYTVAVSYADDLEQMALGNPASEGTLKNNSRGVVVDRGGGPYRVLYVSGRPNWEFKFLNRAVAEDREVDLVGLIRIAKKQPKFDFRRKGETDTSEFFKGFDTDEEEAEQYFEPVLLRIGTRDENELRGGFPKTADDLFKYDAIICDDVEAKYFSFEQMSLIQRFVAERGGGFLMLGGQESFSEGKYTRTPIADLLPVYLRRSANRLDEDGPSIETSGFGSAPDQVFRYRLSRTGRVESWVRLKETEDEVADRLARMPSFESVNQVDGIKPGADELAYVEDPRGNSRAALVVQNYGKGRSGALLVGDLWRWGLNREQGDDDELASAWRQTIRWLVANVPRRVEVNVEQPQQILSDYRFTITVRNEEYLPLDNAELEITVTDPTKKEFKVLATPSESDPGVYEASFPSMVEGNYLTTVLAKNPDGTVIESRQAGWVYAPATRELKDLEPNRKWLEALAGVSGGEVVESEDLESFVNELPNRKIPVQETATFPLWHHLAFFWIAIGCLAGEWGIRRIYGLP